MNRCLINLLVFFALTTSAIGQSSNELKKKQQKLKEDIAYKEKLLKQISEDSKSNSARMTIISGKISQREELIGVLREELDLIDQKIAETNDLVTALEGDIARLREEYAKMIWQAYCTRNTADKIMYIFASADFEQAYRRMKYLQQLTAYRQRQAEAITHAQASLERKRAALESQREEKNSVLESENEEKQTLSREKEEKEKKLQQLKGQESKYKKELAEAQRATEELRSLIKKAIEKEIAEKNKAAGAKSGTTFSLTPEALELSNNFTANKGKLPWPVEKGEVTALFGEHPHPFLSGIVVKNNGITISTTEGAKARAVFDGEVSKILIIQGAGKAVMVRHGEYITVYLNLKETFVNTGDKVKTKDDIGLVLTDKGKASFEFQVWKGTELQNPSSWIYKGK